MKLPKHETVVVIELRKIKPSFGSVLVGFCSLSVTSIFPLTLIIPPVNGAQPPEYTVALVVFALVTTFLLKTVAGLPGGMFQSKRQGIYDGPIFCWGIVFLFFSFGLFAFIANLLYKIKFLRTATERALTLLRGNKPAHEASVEDCPEANLVGDMTPQLAVASSRAPEDRGSFDWDVDLNSDDLEYSPCGMLATWKQADLKPGEVAPRIWVPVQSRARLHSGDFIWDFEVEDMGEGQIGVGFMLDWESIGPDWGFFGYLGSSSSAWAYDPSTGDVVVDTRSTEGGLPVLAAGGVVTVQTHLPRESEGWARFVVAGIASQPVFLPPGAVLVPAACFLAVGQKVTLGNLRQRES